MTTTVTWCEECDEWAGPSHIHKAERLDDRECPKCGASWDRWKLVEQRKLARGDKLRNGYVCRDCGATFEVD